MHMKSVVFRLCLLIVTLFSNPIFAQQANASTILLTNTKTNKSFNVFSVTNLDKLQAIIGKATTIDKQQMEKDEPPIITFNYNGLLIEMQKDKIKNIAITNKKWKLDSFTVGIFLGDVAAKYTEMKKIYAADYNFKLNAGKGCIYVDVDQFKTVKKIGIILL